MNDIDNLELPQPRWPQRTAALAILAFGLVACGKPQEVQGLPPGEEPLPLPNAPAESLPELPENQQPLLAAQAMEDEPANHTPLQGMESQDPQKNTIIVEDPDPYEETVPNLENETQPIAAVTPQNEVAPEPPEAPDAPIAPEPPPTPEAPKIDHEALNRGYVNNIDFTTLIGLKAAEFQLNREIRPEIWQAIKEVIAELDKDLPEGTSWTDHILATENIDWYLSQQFPPDDQYPYSQGWVKPFGEDPAFPMTELQSLGIQVFDGSSYFNNGHQMLEDHAAESLHHWLKETGYLDQVYVSHAYRSAEQQDQLNSTTMAASSGGSAHQLHAVDLYGAESPSIGIPSEFRKTAEQYGWVFHLLDYGDTPHAYPLDAATRLYGLAQKLKDHGVEVHDNRTLMEIHAAVLQLIEQALNERGASLLPPEYHEAETIQAGTN